MNSVVARATTSRHTLSSFPSLAHFTSSPSSSSSSPCLCRQQQHQQQQQQRQHRQISTTSPRHANNHYDTLQLPKQATRQQIKAQFYRLSKEYHPDVKTGNEAKFQAISEAYAILGHADSRRAYDASMTASGPSYQYQHHTSGGATAGGYYPYQDIETASTRRARANYAWQHTRTHSPRWAHPGRHNPFDHHHHSHPNAQHQQHRETFRTTAEQDYFERMQAREAWKASNMSSGARKRAMYEAEKMAKEEDLRNSSSIVRAFQAVGMFLGVLWITGSFKASAQEKVDGEGEGDR